MPSSILPSHQRIRENDHDAILTPFLLCSNNQAFGHEKLTSVDLTHSRCSHILTDYVARVCSSTISFSYLFENLEHDFRKFQRQKGERKSQDHPTVSPLNPFPRTNLHNLLPSKLLHFCLELTFHMRNYPSTCL